MSSEYSARPMLKIWKKRIGSTTCFEKCSNSLMEEEEEEDDSLDFLSSFIW